MAIAFHPLPPEHALAAAGAAIVALGDYRLLVHAHRLVASLGDPGEAVATAYTAFLGFETPGIPWVALSPADVLPALSALVSREVAYHDPVVEERVAREAVGRWLAGFPEPCRAYTNGDVLLDHARARPSGGWFNPVVGATFDTGVIVVAPSLVGMLWAADDA